MRAWLFIGSLGCVIQIQAQISVYDCGAISQIVTQSEIEAANNEYYKQCIMFIPPETYEFNGSLNSKVTAATNIHLREGVHIGPFTQDGQFWLKIQPKSDFDVAVMNYENLNNVLKFEKLELGISLPQDVLTKVNNFVEELPVPNTEKLNPYLDWELRVYAEFTPAVAEWPFVIDGFYTKEYEVNMPEILPIPNNFEYYGDAEYALIGGWDETATNFPFRIRFAPNQIGLWTGKIKIEVNGELIHTSVPFNFNVIESGNVGYVKVGINKRYLRREGTFFPVGCNLNWPETTAASDPLLANYLTKPSGFTPEGYRQYPCIPRVYDKYKDMMTLLSNGGGNYFRWIMYPVSTDIEWEKIGDYTDRLNMAQEMDEIVEHAKDLDLYIHWNMQIHFSLQFSANAYDRRWAWDSEFNNSQYCYRTLINSTNPIDFFTNETAKQYYKQRLRYILARWGYSTNVAVWELFSEISNVGAPEADNNDYYLQGNNWMIYRDWQVEMAEYLKSMYHGQCHLVTASYGGEKHPDDDTFESPYMDIMTSNIYDYEEPDFGLFSINKVASTILNDPNSNSYTHTVTKPMIFSEMDPIDALCDDSRIEVIRNIWQCTFSGLAGALSWDMQITPEHFGVYGQIRNFIEGIDFDAGGWHPGAVDQQIIYDMDYSTVPPTATGVLKNEWTFNYEYAKYMDGLVDVPDVGKRVKKGDFSYLRSGDKNFAIGVLTNKTRNIKNTATCYEGAWPLTILNIEEPIYGYDTLDISMDVNAKDEDLFVTSLMGNKKKYYIEYHGINSDNFYQLSQGKNNNSLLQLKLNFGDYFSGKSIVPVKVRRKNYGFPQFYNSPILEDTLSIQFNNKLFVEHTDSILLRGFKVYPNPVSTNLNLVNLSREAPFKIVISTIDDKTLFEKDNCVDMEILDFSDYNSGIYILKIIHNEQDYEMFKIIKL
jgi:hypothetical protein